MFRLALRTLRRRKGSFVASFIALFLGAVIVMACGGLMETGIRLTIPPQRLANAPIVVTGTQAYTEQARLPASLVQQLQTVAGVSRAVPDISFAAAILHGSQPVNDASQLAGHGWSSTELGSYSLEDGNVPIDSHDVVLNATLAHASSVAVGDTVSIVVQGELTSFQVSGIVTSSTAHNPAIFFSDAEAQQLSGRPTQVDDIGIIPTAGTDVGQLAQKVTETVKHYDAMVLTGDNRGVAEFVASNQDRETLVSIAGVFGGLGIMVTVFIVSGTLGISVQQRRQEMALLRAIGATRKQLLRMILGETMFIAVIATALAYIPSSPFGVWLLGRLSGGGVVSTALVYRQGWVPKVVGIGVALLSAVLAAFVTARGATKVRPTEALAEATSQRHWLGWFRLLCAVLFLGGAAALSIVTAAAMHGPSAAGTATPEIMLWAIALALLGPGLTSTMLFLSYAPVRLLTGLSGLLAMRNLRLRKVRIAGVVIPIMLVTGLATALIYLQTTQSTATTQMAQHTLAGDTVLTSSTGGLPLTMVSKLHDLPEVTRTSAVVSSIGYIGIPPSGDAGDYVDTSLEGVTADSVAQLTTYTARSGSLADLHDDTIALSVHQAGKLNKKVGDTIPVRLGDGTQISVKLVAIVPMTQGYDVALLPASLLVQHTTSGLAQQIAVRPNAGINSEQFATTLQSLRQQYPTLQVTAPAGNNDAAAQNQINVEVSYLLVAMIVVYATVALINTVIITTLERRREFALQRLIGMTRLQIFRTMTVEALVMSLAGIILGTAIAAFTLVPFCLAIKNSPLPDGPFWIYGSIVGGVLALTVITTWITTIMSLRARPITIARSRE